MMKVVQLISKAYSHDKDQEMLACCHFLTFYCSYWHYIPDYLFPNVIKSDFVFISYELWTVNEGLFELLHIMQIIGEF